MAQSDDPFAGKTKRNCTPQTPFDPSVPRDESELWSHEGAELFPEDQDGEILSFRCTTCKHVWSVDCRVDDDEPLLGPP